MPKVKFEINECIIDELINAGNKKLEDAQHSFFSSPASLVEDAIRFYKHARDKNPTNQTIYQKIENALIVKEKLEKEEEKYESHFLQFK